MPLCYTKHISLPSRPLPSLPNNKLIIYYVLRSTQSRPLKYYYYLSGMYPTYYLPSRSPSAMHQAHDAYIHYIHTMYMHTYTPACIPAAGTPPPPTFLRFWSARYIPT
ncbi:hypothetical protein BO78DRAFT_104083 [Aspergillus sclerotiicarbonarius CBS 121057]|uniref:Uncharacterized protein n=1 Tax=Aspergillus sclerotiicarbonarius (strain CBS 121057 / IBT 28362) TaxID=1448318 RepID=A0A319EBL6_ASPSB|nr:hypothetical protein BO78DRAFT_104083 [Aspergillus sclerotiicarbonarius CBS 121057]